MISFGIGLALALSGFTFYELANLLNTPTDSSGVLAAQTAKAVAQFTNIPDAILPYTPYIGIAIIVIGVGWYWIITPLLYLTRPRKEI